MNNFVSNNNGLELFVRTPDVPRSQEHLTLNFFLKKTKNGIHQSFFRAIPGSRGTTRVQLIIL